MGGQTKRPMISKKVGLQRGDYLQENVKGVDQENVKGVDQENVKGVDQENVKGVDQENVKGVDQENVKGVDQESWCLVLEYKRQGFRKRVGVERSRVRIPAGTAGEFSSPGSTFCADSYFGTVPPPCYRSSTYKIPVILPKVQVTAKHAHTLRMWLLLNRASALVTTCP